MSVLTVGLTGGIASGKSTVAKWMRELGCTVVDADQLVAELYRPGEAGTEAVRAMFSESVLDEKGGVDRGKLADVVFRDPEKRRRLEGAIHPLVGMAFRELVARARGLVVFEATLLVETGGADGYDVLVTVEADPELRIERAVARGLDTASARARLAAQTDSATRRARADYVLENEGSLQELRKKVEELVDELKARLSG